MNDSAVGHAILFLFVFVFSASALAQATPENGPARVNPYRLLRRVSGGTTGTHSQTEKSPRQLAYRGIERISPNHGLVRTTAARQQLENHRRLGSLNTLHGSDALRQGLSGSSLVQQLSEADRGRALQQLGTRLQDNGAPNFPQLRSRVTSTGVDPRSMNARLGRSSGAVGGSTEIGRYGAARLRRR